MKRILLCAVSFISVIQLFAQASLPSMMIVPSDAWCNRNGFMKTLEMNGNTVYSPDYRAALMNSNDLNLAITKINGMMAETGYRLIDLSSTLKLIETDEALNSVTTSSMGDSFMETPREQMERVAKADIWLEIDWFVNNVGPKKSLTFIMRALDAYTQNEVASSSGTSGDTYAVEMPVLIEEAVSSYIYGFNSTLAEYFAEMQSNGRDIAIEFRVWENAGFNLESDMGDDMLSYILEDWVAENAIGGNMTPVIASENVLSFREVRIPLVTQEGRQVDARFWTRNLVRSLKKDYGIDTKLYIKGLGSILVVLGEK